MSEDKKRSRADVEWDNRTLCSDESCIGVIGNDGRCKECGRPYEGDFIPLSTGDATEDGYTGSAEDPADDWDEDAAEDHDNDSDSDTDWENRTLCADENCIGVIGPDGRCKECGKPLNEATDA